MRILIVDDEPLARARLKRLLAQLPEHQCVAEAENAALALHYIEQLQPDLVLLDIAMPGQNGIELGCLIRQLAVPPAVIFVTAHPQHALDAYQASPVDYLLKPVDVAQLSVALEKAGKPTRAHVGQKSNDQTISFLQHGVKRQIALTDVYYVVADEKYTRMVFAGGEALLDHSLAYLEQKYSAQLLRIHRATLVNLARIEKLYTAKNAKHFINLRGKDITLEVSRRSLAKVKKALQTQ